MANFEVFHWNFLLSIFPEIGKSVSLLHITYIKNIFVFEAMVLTIDTAGEKSIRFCNTYIICIIAKKNLVCLPLLYKLHILRSC